MNRTDGNEHNIPPPGDYIREELRKRGWTQEDLANVLGRTTARINQIITGKQELSPEIALDLEAALGTLASEWLRRESLYRLSLATAESTSVRRRTKLYELAPVKEMQKRGWVKPVDSSEELEREVLHFFAIPSLDVEPAIHGAMRKTAPATPASPAQRAWAFQVRRVAAAIPSASVPKYDETKLAICRSALRKLASYSAGVAKVPQVLAEFGIRFVIVEGLPGAKLDGFATWLDEQSPVIGMSLKYDRLDSFWFTLGHEMAHIDHRDEAPVDGDVAGGDDPLEVKPFMERRADEESAAMFIPPDELKSFIGRVGPLYSTERINQFANRIKIHPSIIIGQLKARGEIGWSAHNKNVATVREAVVKAAVTDGWGKSINLGSKT